MAKKYELLPSDRTGPLGESLYQIRYLRRGAWGEPGTLGGFVRDDHHLAHTGQCYIGGQAVVTGCSRVSGDARVIGDAIVTDSTIYGRATVADRARVDHSYLFGNAIVAGSATVEGSVVSGHSVVTDHARVQNAELHYAVSVHGQAVIAIPRGAMMSINGHASISEQALIRSRWDFLLLESLAGAMHSVTAYRTEDGSWTIYCGGLRLYTVEDCAAWARSLPAAECREYLALVEIVRGRQNLRRD